MALYEYIAGKISTTLHNLHLHRAKNKLNTAVLYQHLIEIGHLFLTSGYTASILFVAFTKNVRKKSAFSHYIW